MTFQAYLKNIEKKTGVTPDEFIRLAKIRGFVGEGLKASRVVEWLKQDYSLGHGHAMAIYAVLKQEQGGNASR